jgi:hypothetical protein
VAPPRLNASDVARLSNEQLRGLVEFGAAYMSATAGIVALATGELDRRQGFRDDGATSAASWLAARTGISASSARALSSVGARLVDLPHLTQGLVTGDLTFDQVKAVSAVAEPETDARWRDTAQQASVAELTELVRTERPPTVTEDERAHQRRSLRFNDVCRTLSAQLPADSYAEVRAALETKALDSPSDGETPLDARLADALVATVRSGSSGGAASPFTVVAHVPLDVLVDEESPLCGELDSAGLVSGDVVRRLACDASVVVALDDAEGHTMYEGRARRSPTATQRRELTRRDRHCRFPGCHHARFLVPHHLKRWKPDRGPTDLHNLVLLCEHHHHLVHTNGWTATGKADGEVTFAGPDGRSESTRPSPLWTRVTAPRTRGA